MLSRQLIAALLATGRGDSACTPSHAGFLLPRHLPGDGRRVDRLNACHKTTVAIGSLVKNSQLRFLASESSAIFRAPNGESCQGL